MNIVNIHNVIIQSSSFMIHSIYYIGKEILNLEQISKHKRYMCHIEVIFDFTEQETQVLFIRSRIKGKGLATWLLLYVLEKAKEKHMKVICLDDVSDMFRNTRNIYTNIGMCYIDSIGPEMKGDIDMIVKKSKDIKKKHCKSIIELSHNKILII